MIGPPKNTPAPLDRTNPLSGKYDDFYSNAKVYDQKFGLVLTSDNLRNPAKMSLSYGPDNFYPWRPFAAPDRTQKRDKEKQQWLANQFAIHIDVQHFKPSEIRIKVTGRVCSVKARHKDREDDHGYVARKFEREFILPKDIDVDSVKSIISSDGVLTFKAARRTSETANATTPTPENNETPAPVESYPEIESASENASKEDNNEQKTIVVSGQQQESLEEEGIEIPIQFVKESESSDEKTKE